MPGNNGFLADCLSSMFPRLLPSFKVQEARQMKDYVNYATSLHNVISAYETKILLFTIKNPDKLHVLASRRRLQDLRNSSKENTTLPADISIFPVRPQLHQ